MINQSGKRYSIFADGSVYDHATGDALPFCVRGKGSYKTKKRAIKRKLKQMNVNQTCPTPTWNSLGHLPMNTMDLICYPPCVIEDAPTTTWSTNMYSQEMKVQEITSDDKAREHLRERLRDVYCEKDIDLRKKYGLWEHTPQTRQELADALKNGQFIIKDLDKKATDEFNWYESWTSLLRFTLIPEDQKGYEAAHKKLTDAREAARDTIIVSSPADGLKAFRDFEATTFS